MKRISLLYYIAAILTSFLFHGRCIHPPYGWTQTYIRPQRYESGFSGVADFTSGSGSSAQDIPPPARLGRPMQTAFRQINNAGPPDPYPKSKESLDLPQITMMEPALDSIMDDIKEGLQYVFQTRNEFTFPVHGTGTTGMAAVLDNLIEPRDKVLVMSMGYWGDLMANMSARLGANLVKVSKSPGVRFSLQDVRTALAIHRPKILAMVMGESDTAVRQPMDGIGDLARRYGALLAVDVVAVAGMQPVLMDKMKMDAVFTSSSKGLGSVTGLAPVSLSPRALEKLKSRSIPPRAYQTDLLSQVQLWNTGNRGYFQTLSFSLIYSLREALATIAEERLENVFMRHENATKQLSKGLEDMGLKFFVPTPADRMIGITAALPPRGKDVHKIVDFMFKNSNIAISGGFGPTEGKTLRVATFATNADSMRVTNVLRALEEAIQSPETNI